MVTWCGGCFAFALAERWGLIGTTASLGYIDREFQFEFEMSPQSIFNVGIYYTFKQ
jgi:hypothetical protein